MRPPIFRTRGRVALLLLAALVLAVAAAGCGGSGDGDGSGEPSADDFLQFRSRPDLGPPKLDVTFQAAGTAPGYLFISPKRERSPGGLMVLDNDGELVWFKPLHPRQGADLRVQRYRGRPVLTWWEGTQPTIGIGAGRFVIADESYREIAQLEAGNGFDGDLHEFLLTPRGTALIIAYVKVQHDLSSVGGKPDAWVWDNVVQELEIPSGRVVFEWRSLEHVPVAESAQREPAKTATRKAPFDYFHANSVDLDDDGNLLVSARNASAVYKIDRRSGRVLWRLGGPKNDFRMGRGTKFAWQHDARRQDDGTITIFDNSAIPEVADESRALVLRVDEEAKTATLLRAYTHPGGLLAPHQAKMQVLPNGNVLVGWGGMPYVSEHTREGQLLLDAKILVGDSYRAYRFPWTGRPTEPPRAVAEGDDDEVTVYASWNGATEVAEWEVLAGDRDDLEAVERARKEGFETEIDVETDAEYVAVRALDESGDALATSEPVEIER